MGGIHRWPVDSLHKGPVTRKMFPFDDVIMGDRNQWESLNTCMIPSVRHGYIRPRFTLPVSEWLLTLYVLFFQWKHKHVFTFYVILPHWHAINSRNTSSCTTRSYRYYIINAIVADVLATQEARASAAMIFSMFIRINSVSARWELTYFP